MPRLKATEDCLATRATWLERLTRRLTGQRDQDLAQETWVRKLAAERQAEAQHPRALLATIARNLLVDRARRRRAQGGEALAFDDLPEKALPWTYADQESTLLLKQVILGLPELYRDVFILNRFMGLTYVEIAKRQDVSLKTIEYRMSRALALCAAALRD